MNNREYQWGSMHINDHQWGTMAIIEYQWLSMRNNVYHWISMIINEHQWITVNINAYQWTSMNINEYQWISHAYQYGSPRRNDPDCGLTHAVQEPEIQVLARIRFRAWDPPFDSLLTRGAQRMRYHHLGTKNRMVTRVLKSMGGMIVPDMHGVNNRIPRPVSYTHLTLPTIYSV